MPDSNFFKTSGVYTLRQLAEISSCFVEDKHADKMISSVAPIESSTNADITFLSNVKYLSNLESCRAGACIIDKKYQHKAPESLSLLISDNPYFAYSQIASHIFSDRKSKSVVSTKANISKSSIIGEGCTIEAGAYIGEGVKIGNNCIIKSGAYLDLNVAIGNNCIIHSNVNIRCSNIGNNVIIHSGASIGQDGFGYAYDKGVHHKVPQLGRVIIEDNVEIGSNSCIDRGAGPDTVIGAGSKIDNLVQIGHNVKIGRGCIIVSHAGISGSTKIGDYCVIGGQVGVAGHLEIGSAVQIAAQSGVMHNLEAGKVYGGSPAIAVKEWHRQTIAIKNLAKKGKKNG